MWMSDVLPHTAAMADDLCLIRSMWTDHPNHDNALYKIHSGRLFMGYPTVGAWTVYGLGSENQNLPAYVVLNDPLGLPKNGTRNWTSGFLPPLYQGTRFRPTGSPILNLKPQYEAPSAVTASARELLSRLDQIHRRERLHYPELDARIEAYSLAARMQLSAGESLDLSRERAHTLAMYGVGEQETDSFGRRCLLARRLVERGVRFVQIFLEEQPWDSHVDLAANHRAVCRRTDKPVAALLRDLKQRGLLDSTLVIWGGEFGRTPKINERGGRDHWSNAMSVMFAGGGTPGGQVVGATDRQGYAAVERVLSPENFVSTVYAKLGIDPGQVLYTPEGRPTHLVSDATVIDELMGQAS